MTIKTRLLAGMVTIGGLFLVPLVVGVFTLARMRDQITLMRDREFAASVLLARVRSAIDVLRGSEVLRVPAPATASIADIEAQLNKLKALGFLLDSYGLGTAGDSLRAAADAAEKSLPVARGGAVSVPAGIRTTAPLSTLGNSTNRADRAIGAAERSLRESTNARVSEVAAAIQRVEWLLLLTLLAAGLITLIVAIRLSSFVDRPLKALEHGMANVANGEFDQTLGIPLTRRDEFGRLASAFSSMATRLKELEQMRASWLAMGTHELKNEVGPIIGYMDLLTDGVLGPLAPKQLEKCQRTKVLAERLKGHLLKYLAVSQMESGGYHPTLSKFDLSVFLQEIESDFGAMAGSRDVSFAVNRLSTFSHWVNWDRESVREVIENLLSNAFKFTPAGGRITVNGEQFAERVRLSVSDTGAGIAPEDVAHVFGKYFKARNQSKSSEKGTGLGLAIVREIVQAHGGTIRCDSTVGVGTTFTISLPFEAAVANPLSSETRTEPVAERATEVLAAS